MTNVRAARRNLIDEALVGFFALWAAVLWTALVIWATRGTLAWSSACDLSPVEGLGRIASEARYPRGDEDCLPVQRAVEP